MSCQSRRAASPSPGPDRPRVRSARTAAFRSGPRKSLRIVARPRTHADESVALINALRRRKPALTCVPTASYRRRARTQSRRFKEWCHDAHTCAGSIGSPQAQDVPSEAAVRRPTPTGQSMLLADCLAEGHANARSCSRVRDVRRDSRKSSCASFWNCNQMQLAQHRRTSIYRLLTPCAGGVVGLSSVGGAELRCLSAPRRSRKRDRFSRNRSRRMHGLRNSRERSPHPPRCRRHRDRAWLHRDRCLPPRSSAQRRKDWQ